MRNRLGNQTEKDIRVCFSKSELKFNLVKCRIRILVKCHGFMIIQCCLPNSSGVERIPEEKHMDCLLVNRSRVVVLCIVGHS